VDIAGAMPTHCNGLVPSVLPGSENTAKGRKGSPGTWEVPRSPRLLPVGHRLTNSRPTLTHSTALGTKRECNPGYRRAKATERGGMERRTSEHLVVPPRRGNWSRRDPAEGRGCQVMEPLEGNMAGASKPDLVSTRQQRIAELAKQSPQMGFTSLAYHIDRPWLYEAYLRTRPDGAPGVDGQTVADYTANLGDNLQTLLDRAKSGTYRAPPVRRVYIPKGTGGDTRPIGIPTFEDKVLQRAVVMVLEAVFEQDFLDCSYGFRPGRSAHQALDALWQHTTAMGGGWVLEVDIRQFFDTLDHAHLREMLRHRIRDGVLLRLIGKWLNAGVLDDGSLTFPEAGTPQGGVVSPLLANVYLHYVLDVWFEREVKPRLKGRAFLIRYADDFVIGFACEADARRVLDVLPKRFGRYGLTLHPDKTRLVPFQRPPQQVPPRDPSEWLAPGTFTLLGFTHFWGRSRRGFWVVKRKTAPGRLSRALKTIAQWCRLHRHQPLPMQHQTLSQKLHGHFAYYGITGNGLALARFHWWVTCVWKKWLARRRRRGFLSWAVFQRLLQRYPLPPPRVVHSVYRRAGEALT
jgi:RNA-directed DNA polymerase